MSLDVRRLITDADVQGAYPLMAQLRLHLKSDTFLATVREQEAGGYVLLGGFSASRLVTLAGVRDTATLARGRHLFVDDLVTAAGEQAQGYGTAMLRHLADYAASLGISRIYLDSRDTAAGFYRQVGFTFLSSIPCWIDVAALKLPAAQNRL